MVQYQISSIIASIIILFYFCISAASCTGHGVGNPPSPPPHHPTRGCHRASPWRSSGLCRRILDLGRRPQRGPLFPAASSWVGMVLAICSDGRQIFAKLGHRVAVWAATGARSGCWPSSPSWCASPTADPGYAGVAGQPLGCARIWWLGSRLGETTDRLRPATTTAMSAGVEFLHGDVAQGPPFRSPTPCFSGEDLTLVGYDGVLGVVTFLKASP